MDINLVVGLLVAIIILLLVLLVVITCKKTQVTGHRVSSSNMPMSKDYSYLQKFTSRKFLAAIGVFLTTACTTWGVDDLTMEKMTATGMATSGLLAFILSEGYADGHSPTNKNDVLQKKEEIEDEQ